MDHLSRHKWPLSHTQSQQVDFSLTLSPGARRINEERLEVVSRKFDLLLLQPPELPITPHRLVFALSGFGEREFFMDNLLVQIHVIIVMIWWTGLAP